MKLAGSGGGTTWRIWGWGPASWASCASWFLQISLQIRLQLLISEDETEAFGGSKMPVAGQCSWEIWQWAPKRPVDQPCHYSRAVKKQHGHLNWYQQYELITAKEAKSCLTCLPVTFRQRFHSFNWVTGFKIAVACSFLGFSVHHCQSRQGQMDSQGIKSGQRRLLHKVTCYEVGA